MRSLIPAATLCLFLAACIPQRIPVQTPEPSPVTESGSLPDEASGAQAGLPTYPSDFDAPVEPSEEIAPPKTRASGSGSLIERIGDDGILEIGVADAPVTLTVFTNPSCAYCTTFWQEQFPRLAQEFIDPGLLRVRTVILPLKKYPASPLHAAALFCAGKLGKGRGMHDLLISQNLPTRKILLGTIGKGLGLAASPFGKCLDARETKDVLAKQEALLSTESVSLIPTFRIGTDRLTGLPSYPDTRGWTLEHITP